MSTSYLEEGLPRISITSLRSLSSVLSLSCYFMISMRASHKKETVEDTSFG